MVPFSNSLLADDERSHACWLAGHAFVLPVAVACALLLVASAVGELIMTILLHARLCENGHVIACLSGLGLCVCMHVFLSAYERAAVLSLHGLHTWVSWLASMAASHPYAQAVTTLLRCIKSTDPALMALRRKGGTPVTPVNGGAIYTKG